MQEQACDLFGDILNNGRLFTARRLLFRSGSFPGDRFFLFRDYEIIIGAGISVERLRHFFCFLQLGTLEKTTFLAIRFPIQNLIGLFIADRHIFFIQRFLKPSQALGLPLLPKLFSFSLTCLAAKLPFRLSFVVAGPCSLKQGNNSGNQT